MRARSGRPVDPRPDVKTGYQMVKTAASFGERFSIRLHRLKFLLLHGYLPDEVDHRDRNGADSCEDNLRPATRSQNASNRGRQSNALPRRGVRRVGRRWGAHVTFEGRGHHLGYYDTKDEASAVVEGVLENMHGEFYVEH